jgi:O-antigen ligase
LIAGTATFRGEVVSYATSGDGFTSARLESSSTTRFVLWKGALGLVSSHPLGVGPEGMVNRDGLDVLPNSSVAPHNDFLGYFIERGVLGLVGLLGFVVRLLQLSLPGGIARVALFQCGVGAFFHDTLHYRHLWLLLALAYAADRRRASPYGDERRHSRLAPSRR